MTEPLDLDPIKARLECGAYGGLDAQLYATSDIEDLLAEVARLRAVVASPEIARLAYEGARVQHVNAAPCNEFLTSTGVHVFVATDDDYGFATCPHPDCVLARDVLTRPPGASCASEAPK